MTSSTRRPKREPDFKYNGLICEYSVWAEEGLITASDNKQRCQLFDAYDIYVLSLKSVGLVAASYKRKYEEYMSKIAEQELLGE